MVCHHCRQVPSLLSGLVWSLVGIPLCPEKQPQSVCFSGPCPPHPSPGEFTSLKGRPGFSLHRCLPPPGPAVRISWAVVVRSPRHPSTWLFQPLGTFFVEWPMPDYLPVHPQPETTLPPALGSGPLLPTPAPHRLAMCSAPLSASLCLSLVVILSSQFLSPA